MDMKHVTVSHAFFVFWQISRSGFDFFRRVKTLRYTMTSFQDSKLK